jgi:hypothetical protein
MITEIEGRANDRDKNNRYSSGCSSVRDSECQSVGPVYFAFHQGSEGEFMSEGQIRLITVPKVPFTRPVRNQTLSEIQIQRLKHSDL